MKERSHTVRKKQQWKPHAAACAPAVLHLLFCFALLFMITTNCLTVIDAHPIQVGLVALALFTITLFARHIHTTH